MLKLKIRIRGCAKSDIWHILKHSICSNESIFLCCSIIVCTLQNIQQVYINLFYLIELFVLFFAVNVYANSRAGNVVYLAFLACFSFFGYCYCSQPLSAYLILLFSLHICFLCDLTFIYRVANDDRPLPQSSDRPGTPLPASAEQRLSIPARSFYFFNPGPVPCYKIVSEPGLEPEIYIFLKFRHNFFHFIKLTNESHAQKPFLPTTEIEKILYLTSTQYNKMNPEIVLK